MKIVVFGIVAFVLALGGTTAAMVMTHRAAKGAEQPALAQHPDSAQANDSVHLAEHADSAKADSAHQPVQAAKPETVTVAAHPAPAVSAAPHQTAEREQAYKPLARIFTSMKPAEAVKVMALLKDEEIEGILRNVGPRQAADLLANFPTERAAVLSRRLLVAAPKTEDSK